MLSHLLIMWLLVTVCYIIHHVMPKNDIEIQCDENVKEANRIINLSKIDNK